MEIKIVLANFIRGLEFELTPGINYGFKMAAIYTVDPPVINIKKRDWEIYY